MAPQGWRAWLSIQKDLDVENDFLKVFVGTFFVETQKRWVLLLFRASTWRIGSSNLLVKREDFLFLQHLPSHHIELKVNLPLQLPWRKTGKPHSLLFGSVGQGYSPRPIYLLIRIHHFGIPSDPFFTKTRSRCYRLMFGISSCWNELLSFSPVEIVSVELDPI